MKIETCVLTLLAIFSDVYIAKSQDPPPLAEESRLTLIDTIRPPMALRIFRFGITTTSASFVWREQEDATSYTLRVYTKENNVLYREMQNLVGAVQNVTGLKSGTTYTVTVSAVYTNSRGQRLESSESKPVEFLTMVACKGGQERTQCTAHCVSTCDNPDPVCSRICSSGCACPRVLPIWHEETCLPRQLCPAARGRPKKPQNVRVLPAAGLSEILLTWDPIEDAESYTIRVKLASDRNRVVRTLESTRTLVFINGLEDGEIYIFSVRANIRMKSATSGRSTLLPPPGVQVSRVTERSFQVTWLSRNDATRYAFVLYDESRENVLYLNEQIAGNIVEIEGLAPGTIYFFSVATADRRKNPAIFSPPRGLRTRGESTRDLDNYHSAEVVDRIAPPTTTTTEATTTTTKETTTTTEATTTTTAPLTLCQERFASVSSFYQGFPDVDGPSYPNCDAQGLFVTTDCFDDAPSVCRCLNPLTGEKIPGSDYGGSNSRIRLNCDRYGSFSINRINVQLDEVSSSSLRVRWSSVRGIRGYVMVIEEENEEEYRTMSMNSNVHLQVLTDLLPGETYRIGIFAVNNDGWSSPISYTEATTNFIDPPENLKITDISESRVTLEWGHSRNADFYLVRVIVTSTGQVFRNYNRVVANTLTIDRLVAGVGYSVEVRAFLSVMDENLEVASHFSNPAIIRVTLRVTTTMPPQECDRSRPLDLIYVFDTSNVSTWEGLQRQKSFFSAITSALPPINLKTGTRVATVKYYKRTNTVFNYNRFHKRNNILTSMRFLPYDDNELYTATMLEYITNVFFSNPNRGSSYTKREGALSVVIIFNAGPSKNTRAEVTEAAARLRDVANVIVIGIEGQSDDAELSEIASRPDLKITVPSFDDLNQAVDRVIDKFCSLN